LRLTSIHYGRLIPHFPGGYRSALLRDFAHPKSHIFYLRNLKRSFAAAKSSIPTAFCLDTKGEQMVDLLFSSQRGKTERGRSLTI
jgi:hypothetical protein